MKTAPLLVLLMLLPSIAFAQEDSWSQAISSDVFTFSTNADTVRPTSIQVELGAIASKPSGDPFNLSFGLTGRYGLVDGFELRLAIPEFVLVFDDTGSQAGIITLFETAELGVKWSFKLSESLTLALLPKVIAPTTFGEAEIFGAGLGLLARIALGSDMSLTANILPQYQHITLDDVSSHAFDLSGTVLFNIALSQQLDMFLEGWATFTNDIGVTPGINFGMTYHFLPNLEAGLTIGLDADPTFHGALGVAYRWD